jgi:exopolysaccharide biosynthesis polyprenyl glycosylphosphotransferase
VSAGNIVEYPELLEQAKHLPTPDQNLMEFENGALLEGSSQPFTADFLLTRPTQSVSYAIIKRCFDIAFALAAVVFTAPILICIALLIKLTSPGPIFFLQERVGRSGNIFQMIKFRTMRVTPRNVSDRKWTVDGDTRVTSLGAFLRRTSLDELPQFFNVLKGEMSVVGPRPERPYFVDKFEQQIEGYSQRHLGRVGITGWAQVNGLRGDTCIRTRVDYDVYYLQNWSLAFDIRIILLTVFSTLRDRQAY